MSAPKGICLRCGGIVEAAHKAAYGVTGYERERSAGGANHIVDRERIDGQIWHDRWSGDCFAKRKIDQPTLYEAGFSS